MFFLAVFCIATRVDMSKHVMAAVEMQKICVTFEATYIARRGATIH
jgi:hypothetical protein